MVQMFCVGEAMAMECPHCTYEIVFRPDTEAIYKIGEGDRGGLAIMSGTCIQCKDVIVIAAYGRYGVVGGGPGGTPEPVVTQVKESEILRPKFPKRKPHPPEVPGEYRTDFEEAVNVLTASAKPAPLPVAGCSSIHYGSTSRLRAAISPTKSSSSSR